MNSREEENQVLLILKSLEYLDKTKKHIYDTSVMWTGQSYSFKYYLKRPEYLKNDFRKLSRMGKYDLAHKLLKEVENILRFEITLRSAKIKSLLGVRIPQFSDLINGVKPLEELVFDILNYYHKRIFKVDLKIQDKIIAFGLLRNMYGKKKARRLEEYLNMYQGDIISNTRSKDNYSYTQRWRNLKDIKDAGVGIHSSGLNVNFIIDKTKLFTKEPDRAFGDI